jgi:hypothetical protein
LYPLVVVVVDVVVDVVVIVDGDGDGDVAVDDRSARPTRTLPFRQWARLGDGVRPRCSQTGVR